MSSDMPIAIHRERDGEILGYTISGAVHPGAH